MTVPHVYRRPAWFRTVLLFGAGMLLLMTSVTGQTKGQSPSDLIRFLTDPERHLTFRCGLVSTDRAAAASLAKLGGEAIQELEKALDSLDRRGERSEFATGAGWLALAYAKIKGPDAYPRLARLIANPRLASLRIDLEAAAELSLGLTSYLDSSRPPSDVVCRAAQPRDALDRLILTWERNERSLFQANLGPDATAALNSLLRSKSWAAMRTDIWNGRHVQGAVAYRFDIAGQWSEPEETLEQKRDPGNAPLKMINPELDVFFNTSSGRACGRHRVRFLGVKTGTGAPFPGSYVVDNSDLGDLLRLISSCAANNRRDQW
jgi:hypothetical protein